MKFTFTEKKMDSSEELRAYSEKKIGKLDRFFKTEAEAFVTYSIERGRFRAEITIKNGGLFYRASELILREFRKTYCRRSPVLIQCFSGRRIRNGFQRPPDHGKGETKCIREICIRPQNRFGKTNRRASGSEPA